jgi:16S rRNA (adenine1518-N6/adenine1519-N6)-dimethyltransferase
MSLLALSVLVFGSPRAGTVLAPSSFYPEPKVQSEILRIDLHPNPRVDPERLDGFFRILKAGFSQRRKQLRNSLAGGLRVAPALVGGWLARAGLAQNSRAQELSLEEWDRLAGAIESDLPAQPAQR